MTDEQMFDKAVKQIAAKHQELGYKRPWRFLYARKATLRLGCDLLVVGLNPADNRQNVTGDPVVWASCEQGNAFHPDCRKPDVGVKLASQGYADRLCIIFSKLAQAQRWDSWKQLMFQTPTSNFCPFRAPGGLPKDGKSEAKKFSQTLWHGLLDHFQPRVLLCLGNEAAKEFASLCPGGTRVEKTMHPSARPRTAAPTTSTSSRRRRTPPNVWLATWAFRPTSGPSIFD